jgi:hypothetical protein
MTSRAAASDVRPLTVSVQTAARLLGISRSVAYECAKEYERTSGRSGLPVIRLGRRLVVPTKRLEAMLGLDDQ